MSKDNKNASKKDVRSEADIAADFAAFGHVFRGGSRPRPLNARHGAITHAEFAKTDGLFIKACELAGVKPTTRQAAKYRNKRGAAYQFKGAAAHQA
jgi:hypothetical protein